MLNINDELGFQDYFSATDWQVPTDSILEYLSREAVAV